MNSRMNKILNSIECPICYEYISESIFVLHCSECDNFREPPKEPPPPPKAPAQQSPYVEFNIVKDKGPLLQRQQPPIQQPKMAFVAEALGEEFNEDFLQEQREALRRISMEKEQKNNPRYRQQSLELVDNADNENNDEYNQKKKRGAKKKG